MSDYTEDLIAKVAWYYYIESMTQQTISDRLGISRMRVIKLLDEARSTGVIQFKIAKDKGVQLQIEKQLRDKYGLQDAYVIPSPGSSSYLNEALAQAAAFYIADRLGENSFINMGYGDTLSRVLNHLATVTDKPVSIVSLTGGVNYYLPNAESNVFKARLFLYPAPLMMSSKEVANAIRKEPSVAEIQRMIRLASLSVVGIGAMNDEATVISNGIFSKNDFTYLKMQGAVGDVLTHFIDKDGVQIHADLEDRLISTPLSVLKELKNVIGIAGGDAKLEVMRATLRGKIISSLITDEDTARKLVEE
jgi:lsr operon transcriptional repressor